MMVLEYTGGNDRGRSELNDGTRVLVMGTYRTNELGLVSTDALPEIRECLRDMRIRLSFNTCNPFARYGSTGDFLMWWKEV